MKKTFKIVLIGGGVLVALLVAVLAAAAIIIPIKYPPEKMRAMATEKLSQALHRKVSIGEVHFNVFSGFKISGLKVSNREGWMTGSFVSAKEISISYHLWPLLTGRIALGEIDFVEPQILVERRGLNQFNFTDMMGEASKTSPGTAPASTASSSAGKGSSTTAKAGAGALALSVDSFRIDHGKMAYVDETAKPAQRYDLGDLNIRVDHVSLLGDKTTFSLDTPFSYDQAAYLLSVKGALRYSALDQSLKDLQVSGKVNDLDFELSGSAKNLSGDFTPNMDGSASLDMLKFSGLVPKSLSSMPEGLSLSGPARVNFHLSGTSSQGLQLKGTADGADLAMTYKDLFVKEAKVPCKLDFTSVMGPNFYSLPSFHAVFKDWEMDGSFRYQNGDYYSCELHSKSLPLKGIPQTVPRWNKAAFSGEASLNLKLSQKLGKPKTLQMDGEVGLKDIGIALPGDPHIFEDLNGTIFMKGPRITLTSATFNAFEGKGAASLAVNFGVDPTAYSYAFSLRGVSAQEAVNGWVDMAIIKNPEKYKDKISGTMDLSYQGTGSGFSTEQAETSAVGLGAYDLLSTQLKDESIKALNSLFKDKSDEISFDKISGKLGLKKQVFSYTADSVGKVGRIRVAGAANFDGYYAPAMTLQCDLRKEFLDSDALQKVLGGKDLSLAVGEDGTIPADVKFTGKCSENHYTILWDRLLKNVGRNLTKTVGKTLGDKLKGLFGQ